MEKQVYQCPKCGCTSFEHDHLQATGGTMAKLFDIPVSYTHLLRPSLLLKISKMALILSFFLKQD